VDGGKAMRPFGDFEAQLAPPTAFKSVNMVITFLMEVCKLWVFIRESLVSFEGNSISSYFDKLLEANTVGVRDIIPLFQILLGVSSKRF
jgi:hypothetical protein